jgi:hypothetical protein
MLCESDGGQGMQAINRFGRIGVFPVILILTALAGCKTGAQSSANGAGSTSSPAPQALTISGTPAGSVGVGTTYTFAPVATGIDGGQLGFSIQNKPAWMNFDAATGQLAGAPTAAEVGTYANILITVTDGTSSAALPMFSISVTAAGAGMGTATLSWVPPTTNTDGTALVNLSGYRIYYGNAAGALTQLITITNTGLTNYVIANLSAGTWYFAVKAYNNVNVESDLSPIVHKTM